MAKYLKKDSELGFVEDSVEIEYLKFNNLRQSILGCMLGDFDDCGNYVINKDIIKELISMPKKLVDSYENVEICQSLLKLNRHISFMITYNNDSATLSLIEKLNYEANFKLDKGSYSNLNEYILETIETSGEINKNAIYSKWNISVFGGNEIDVFNCDEEVKQNYSSIIKRFKYLLQANRLLFSKESELENTEVEYFKSVMDILKNYPKFKKAVEEYIKDTINSKKNFLNVEKFNFHKTLNEILESAINANIELLGDKDRKEFEVDLKNAKLVLNTNRLSVVNILNTKLEGLNVLTLELGIFDDFDDDIKEIANAYIQVLRNGKLNPRFDVILFLISIGVLGENVGYKEDKKNEDAKSVAEKSNTATQAKSLVKKVEEKKKADKKKDAKKAGKKADKKKEVKKDDKSKDTKNKDDVKKVTPSLIVKKKKRRPIVIAGSLSTFAPGGHSMIGRGRVVSGMSSGRMNAYEIKAGVTSENISKSGGKVIKSTSYTSVSETVTMTIT